MKNGFNISFRVVARGKGVSDRQRHSPKYEINYINANDDYSSVFIVSYLIPYIQSSDVGNNAFLKHIAQTIDLV